LPLPGWGRALEVSPVRLCRPGFRWTFIIDISNPAQPWQVGRFDSLYWRANAVKVSGNYAYVTGYYNNFTILDVSNPATPVVPAR